MGDHYVTGKVKVNYEILYDDGTTDVFSTTTKATAYKSVDPAYGADADGNRGISLTWYEDIEVDMEQIKKDIDEYFYDTVSEGGKLPRFKNYSVDEESFEEDIVIGEVAEKD